jgi:hypothetical protein
MPDDETTELETPQTAPAQPEGTYHPVLEVDIGNALFAINEIPNRGLRPQQKVDLALTQARLEEAMGQIAQQRAFQAEMLAQASKAPAAEPPPATPAKAVRARAAKQAAPSKRTNGKVPAAKATARRR